MMNQIGVGRHDGHDSVGKVNQSNIRRQKNIFLNYYAFKLDFQGLI